MNPITLLPLFLLLSASQTCLPSHFFNGQRCAPCQANCRCSEQHTCSSCLPGYTFDAKLKNCLPCPVATSPTSVGCSECCYQLVETEYVCSACPALSGTYLLGGQCVRLEGCNSVTDDGRCQGCNAGYYLRNGVCGACHASCATCPDTTVCTACAAGYYNGTNANAGHCVACALGCSLCTSSSSCSACLSGYRLTGSTCAACPGNCLTCTATQCTQCSAGYAIVAGACQACNLASNGGSIGCLQCTSAANLITCTLCNSGYYLSSAGSCQTCTSRFANSILCTQARPLQCRDDLVPVLTNRYYLVNGQQCVANSNRCKTMLNAAGHCQSCYFQPGAYYRLLNNACTQCSQTGCASYSSTCVCLSCQAGYQFLNGQCVACQNLHCHACQNNVISCEACAPFYGLISSACIACTQPMCRKCDGDSTKCITCDVGYYNTGGVCYRCQSSCQSCVSAVVCSTCNLGYYLLANGRCKQLPSNCVVVGSTGQCTKCAYGYQTLLGNCVPCSSSLFNLDQCERYCPSYYALLKFEQIGLQLLLAVSTLGLVFLF